MIVMYLIVGSLVLFRGEGEIVHAKRLIFERIKIITFLRFCEFFIEVDYGKFLLFADIKLVD